MNNLSTVQVQKSRVALTVRGTGDWHHLMARRTRCVLSWLLFAVRCEWELSNGWVTHQPALSIPVNEHRAFEVFHTAPTSQHKPPEVPLFSPTNFVLLEKETLKGKSLVKEGLSPWVS